jgi:hypothetical protein
LLNPKLTERRFEISGWKKQAGHAAVLWYGERKWEGLQDLKSISVCVLGRSGCIQVGGSPVSSPRTFGLGKDPQSLHVTQKASESIKHVPRSCVWGLGSKVEKASRILFW